MTKWLQVVTIGYGWLQVVMGGYGWLRLVTGGYGWLLVVTRGYVGLQRLVVTGGCELYEWSRVVSYRCSCVVTSG